MRRMSPNWQRNSRLLDGALACGRAKMVKKERRHGGAICMFGTAWMDFVAFCGSGS